MADHRSLEELAARLRELRSEIATLTAEEETITKALRYALLMDARIPGVKLSRLTPTRKWTSNAVPTAQEISPDLTRLSMVPIGSVDKDLLEECERHGIIERKCPTPRVILVDSKPEDNSDG